MEIIIGVVVIVAFAAFVLHRITRPNKRGTGSGSSGGKSRDTNQREK